MHGLALTSLLDRPYRTYMMASQTKKIIEDIEEHQKKCTWNTTESISYRERVAVGFLSRLRKSEPKRQWKQWEKEK